MTMTYDASLSHPDDKTTFELTHREIGESRIEFRTWISNYTIRIIPYAYSSMPEYVCPYTRMLNKLCLRCPLCFSGIEISTVWRHFLHWLHRNSESCQNDNPWCWHWRKFHQNDGIYISNYFNLSEITIIIQLYLYDVTVKLFQRHGVSNHRL